MPKPNTHYPVPAKDLDVVWQVMTKYYWPPFPINPVISIHMIGMSRKEESRITAQVKLELSGGKLPIITKVEAKRSFRKKFWFGIFVLLNKM